MPDRSVIRLPSPSDVADGYRAIVQAISGEIVGHDETVRRLALAGLRHKLAHLYTDPDQRAMAPRLLIVAPSGSGKTSLAVALAKAIDLPRVVWDVGSSSEPGWSGVDLGDVMADLLHTAGGDLEAAADGIVILDEMHHMAVGEATGVSREHRRGQQKSLLALAGAGLPVRFHVESDRGRVVSINPARLMIVGCGVFPGAGPNPGPGDLIRLGIMPELASRFSTIIGLQPLSIDQLAAVITRDVEAAISTARAFGYAISIPEPVVVQVAQVIADNPEELTPRAGSAWLVAAVERATIRLLELEARQGAAYVISIDDVPVPASLAIASVAVP